MGGSSSGSPSASPASSWTVRWRSVVMQNSSAAHKLAAEAPRAKKPYLVNACAPLNIAAEEPFFAALDAGGVTISRLALVLGICRSRAARLVAGIQRPTLAERTKVIARWGSK